MSLLGGLLLSVFLVSVLGVMFISHPVGYCLLLLFGSLSYCGFINLCVSLDWYLLLFCLVYVGGIFILVVYLSGVSSNSFVCLSGGWFMWFWLLLFLFFICCCLMFCGSSSFVENSHYLCSSELDFGYCFFCVVLLISFGVVSCVSACKGGFFR